MLKKALTWVAIFAISTVMFQGCAKPPPPPPISPSEVDKACEDAMAKKKDLESLEKQRDMLKAQLAEKQARMEKSKQCAESN